MLGAVFQPLDIVYAAAMGADRAVGPTNRFQVLPCRRIISEEITV
jgi:hypothetical protein